MNVARIASKNIPQIILKFRVSKIYSCLCTHVRYLGRKNILKREVMMNLMVVYQSQPVEFHYDEIQAEK